MLSAYLPSWIQDFPGVLNTSPSMLSHGVGASLSVGVVCLFLGIVCLWAFDRLVITDRISTRPDWDVAEDPSAHLHRLPPQSLLGKPSLLQTATSASVPVEPAMVLVVDDSTLVRTKLGRLLTSAGYRVTEAHDGQHAWELLQSSPPPAVIITDLEMPVLDGFELIAAVHGGIETEHVPIIAITGREDLRARIADLSGIYGIFKKPWNDRDLIRRVDGLVALGAITKPATVALAMTT